MKKNRIHRSNFEGTKQHKAVINIKLIAFASMIIIVYIVICKIAYSNEKNHFSYSVSLAMA
jgi:hypothetical protein